MVLIAAAAMLCGTTSCNHNDPDAPTLFYEIATLKIKGADASVFSFRKENDSPLVEMTFPIAKSSLNGYDEGKRYIIAYTSDSGDAYASGMGVLYAIGYVYNSAITEGTAQSTGAWATMQQNIMSLWRSGEWINIQAECTYNTERPKTYSLVVDETTLDMDYPEVHLIYEPDETGNANTKMFYATFDISDVWMRPNVKGITLYAVGNSGPKTYTFDK